MKHNNLFEVNKTGLTPEHIKSRRDFRVAQKISLPKSGFTLVELLVSAGLFAVVVSLVTGVFVNMLRSQRALIALIASYDNAELVIEQLAREARLGTDFTNTGNTSLQFTNSRGQSVLWSFESSNNSITRSVDSGQAERLTARNVNVEDFFVRIYGQGQNPSVPPRITISIEITPTLNAVKSARTNLQTTISPRQ